MKKKAYVLLGKPGVGKELYRKQLATILSKRGFSLFMSDTGSLFRDAQNNGPNSPYLNEYNKRRIDEIQSSGILQAASHATMMWMLHFSATYDGQEYVIMDGSPRRIEEFYVLHQYLEEFIDANVIYIYIDAADELVIKRMLDRHKVAPRPETSTPKRIQKRLDEFYEKNYPTITFIMKKYPEKILIVKNESTEEDLQKQAETFLAT